MKSRKNYLGRFLAMTTVVSMLGTTACSFGDSKPDKDMVLKIYGSSSLITNGGVGNPWTNIAFTTQVLFRNLFIAEAGSADVQLDLAESYTKSDDGLVYEIVLKDNVIWSDDEKVDIEDVIFSIESVLFVNKANTLFTIPFSTIVGADEYINGQADSISGLVADGNKLTITLTKPYSNFLLSLAQFAILPEHILGAADLSTFSDNDYWLNPVVCGIYKMGEHIAGESLEYIYNDKYAGDPPYINSLLLRNDYELQELDYAETNDISQILDYRATSNKTEHQVNNLFYRYFVYNIEKGGEIDPVMSDIRVRQAITYAIDRDALVSDIYYNTGEVNNTGVVQDFNNPLDVDYPYDPEKARELLAEAEYDFDRPLVLLSYYSDDTSNKFMQTVGKYLEEVGFTIEFIEQGNLYNEECDHYDIGLKGLAAYSILEWYMEYQSSNQMHTNVFGGEPMFDELIDSFNSVQNIDERLVVLKELQELEYELLYKYPIFTMGHMVYINNARIELPEDVEFGSPRFKYDIKIEEWKVEK